MTIAVRAKMPAAIAHSALISSYPFLLIYVLISNPNDMIESVSVSLPTNTNTKVLSNSSASTR